MIVARLWSESGVKISVSYRTKRRQLNISKAEFGRRVQQLLPHSSAYIILHMEMVGKRKIADNHPASRHLRYRHVSRYNSLSTENSGHFRTVLQKTLGAI